MHSDLKDKFHHAQEAGLCMVAWRLPNEKKVNYIEPTQEKLWQGEESESPFFVFAPFSDESPAFCTYLDAQNYVYVGAPKSPATSNKLGYMTLVAKSVEAIQSGKYNKLVAARVIEEDLPNFDPFDHFSVLMERHENAFCYIWYSPSTGMWMGASPELLLARNNEQIQTMALAGTRSAGQGDFGDKELEEQDIVLQYLEKTLKPYSKSLNITNKTKANSGHLTHLKNEISAELRDPTQNIFPIIRALHPTPAVAGLPKKEAMDFLVKEEGFSRSYYAGYLGLHAKNASHLFVNLRCMQVLGEKQYIYVGAGLTAQSNPELEWLETEEKARVVRLS